MKNAAWEPSPGSLLTFLNGATALRMADLYTFRLTNGTTLRYTTGDVAATIDGATYVLGPKVDRTLIKSAVGVSVDTLTLELYAEDAVLVGGVSMLRALAAGAFDGATVVLERAFYSPDNVVQGTIVLFLGRVGDVQTERGHATLEVWSHVELLDVMIPSAVYQPSCRNTLFDLNCGASRAAFKVSASASTATDAARTSFSANLSGTAAAASGYLALGKATCTAGLNAGVSRTLKAQNGNTVVAIAPWPFAVQAGDSFDFYPGCDKTKATCAGKYNRLDGFSAEPFIPLPDMVT